MKNTKFILAVFLLLIATAVNAQQYMAVNDNYFVVPGSTMPTSLDILVNDALGGDMGCVPSQITLSFPSGVAGGPFLYTTSKGRFTINPATKALNYTPNTGAKGDDVFPYSWTCKGTTKTATVSIKISDKPEFISDAECYVEPTPMVWGIKRAYTVAGTNDDDQPSAHAAVMTGDIDGDGEIEMIIPNNKKITGSDWAYDRLLVYAINKMTNVMYLKYYIPMANTVEAPYKGILPSNNYAIAKMDGDTYASLYVADITGKLIKWKFVPGGIPTISNSFVQEWNVPYETNIWYRSPNPTIIDLMEDGNKQILINDKIFDAKTGFLLAQLKDAAGNTVIPTTGLSSYSFGRFGHTAPINERDESHATVMYPIDIDGDGIKEIIGGDCVYKVNLVDYSATAATNPANTFSLFRRANRDPINNTTILNPARIDIYDGSSVPIDLDLDGKLEIVVSTGGPLDGLTGYLYVYDPLTGVIKSSNAVSLQRFSRAGKGSHGPSMPFIGDIDGDGYPEICVTEKFKLNAFKFNGSNLVPFWNLATTDESAATTLSLFDFAQDGLAKLVYRDENDLRIIDGRSDAQLTAAGIANRVLYTFPGIYSLTINEVPTIADVNGDNAAEIIVTGMNAKTPPYTPNRISVYSSSTTPWAPARSVWNQFAYNPLNVNDDLTIPRTAVDMATSFYRTDGGKEHPFNNFLQQATNLNREGTMITLGPDLQFNPNKPKKLEYINSGTNIKISFGLMNTGDAQFSGDITITIWKQVGSTFTAVASDSYTNKTIDNAIGFNTSNLDMTFLASQLTLPFDMLYISINLSSDPSEIPVLKVGHPKECNLTNNIAAGVSLAGGRKVICEGDRETLFVEPKGIYFLKWYDKNRTLVKASTDVDDNWYTITKNSDPNEYYLLECYKTNSDPTPILPTVDTVWAFLPPAELHWSGAAGNQDYHDFQNWSNPNQIYTDRIESYVPRYCTNVVIPAGISNYPDLTDLALGGHTDYSIFETAQCNNITFDHGGELQRPDSLHYVKALFGSTLLSHKWYSFAPPLKDFYTRDFYLNNVIPNLDIVKTYARGWAKRNPETLFYGGEWTNTFNTPNITFQPGQAFGLWISDKSKTDPNIPSNDPFSWKFPKPDTQYYIYNENTNKPALGPFATPRNNSFRFIFDGKPDAAGNFDLKVDSEDPKVNDYVLIGNPFFSNLDFDKFYAANSLKITPQYYIPDENGNWSRIYDMSNIPASNLTRYIAPMQGFLVKLRTAGTTTLVANGAMSATSPGNIIKSVQDEEDDPYLIIEAHQGTDYSRTFLGFSGKYKNEFDINEDLGAIFMTNKNEFTGLMVYSETPQKARCFSNRMNFPAIGQELIIPINMQSMSSENITLNISNLPSLTKEGYNVQFYDALTKEYISTKYNTMHTFRNVTHTSSMFLENRFYVIISKSASGLVENFVDNSVSVSIDNGLLTITSSTENIDNAQVFSLNGQRIMEVSPRSMNYTSRTPLARGVYIVHLKTASGKLHAKKIIVI